MAHQDQQILPPSGRIACGIKDEDLHTHSNDILVQVIRRLIDEGNNLKDVSIEHDDKYFEAQLGLVVHNVKAETEIQHLKAGPMERVVIETESEAFQIRRNKILEKYKKYGHKKGLSSAKSRMISIGNSVCSLRQKNRENEVEINKLGVEAVIVQEALRKWTHYNEVVEVILIIFQWSSLCLFFQLFSLFLLLSGR